jgi:uncharacterized membrane protein HdeD (DUF308 family)
MTKSRKMSEKTNGAGSIIWGILLIGLGAFFGYAATTAGSMAYAISFWILGTPFIVLGILYILSTKFSRIKKFLDTLGGAGILTS